MVGMCNSFMALLSMFSLLIVVVMSCTQNSLLFTYNSRKSSRSRCRSSSSEFQCHFYANRLGQRRIVVCDNNFSI